MFSNRLLPSHHHHYDMAYVLHKKKIARGWFFFAVVGKIKKKNGKTLEN